MAEHNGAAHEEPVQESAPSDGHRDGNGPAWEDQGHGDDHRPVRFPVDSQVVADPGGTRLMSEGHPAVPRPQRPKRHWMRWLVIGAIIAAILGAGW
jgi:hypothetical protein